MRQVRWSGIPISFRMFLGEHKFSTPLDKYQGRRFLDCMPRVCLLLYKTIKLSSGVAVLFHIPTSNEWGFPGLHRVISTWCCQGSSASGLSKGVLVVSSWFRLHSITYEVKHLLICSSAIWISSWVNCLQRSLAHFKNRVVYFLSLNFKNALCVLDNNF